MLNVNRLAAVTLPIGLALAGCASSPTAPDPAATRQAIGQVLATQAAAWNRGDLPAFMAGYWHSDSLVFIGKRGATYGWQPTLDNYIKSYGSTPGQMGQLDFSQLRITPLPGEVAQVVGHWHLGRPTAAEGDLQGQFLLIFRRIDGRWVIVADHSS